MPEAKFVFWELSSAPDLADDVHSLHRTVSTYKGPTPQQSSSGKQLFVIWKESEVKLARLIVNCRPSGGSEHSVLAGHHMLLYHNQQKINPDR